MWPDSSHFQEVSLLKVNTNQIAKVYIWNKRDAEYPGLMCEEGILVRPCQKRQMFMWIQKHNSLRLGTFYWQCQLYDTEFNWNSSFSSHPKRSSTDSKLRQNRRILFTRSFQCSLWERIQCRSEGALRCIPQGPVCCVMVIYRSVRQNS